MAVQGHAGPECAGVCMKIAFRADASLQIGTGHVMRCLTLADALAAKGADCQFICRTHKGNLIDFIRARGYAVHVLPTVVAADINQPASDENDSAAPVHSHWLGATQSEDAQACIPILAGLHPDWLIVDHYALDARWERALKPHHCKLMVIDDLADRPHDCNLLLDQTFGRAADDYRAWVPSHCQLLCGSQYALLRPEFAALRPYSLQRRTQPALRELLINMGGVDKDNVTGQVLQALNACPPPANCRITVVMGATAPWLDAVRNQAQEMCRPTRVLAGVGNMAQLMADSDLAIGAAGTTAWERCCLGLPSIMLILADNQRTVARGLTSAGAALVIDEAREIAGQLAELLEPLIRQPATLLNMSQSAMGITDGNGAETIAQFLLGASI